MSHSDIALPRRGNADTPAILSAGFRPFFLAAAAFAALALPLWMAMLAAGIAVPGPFDGLRWHAHEMIFGFVAAVVAGFALTAVPNWTGRLPVRGASLAVLVGLWLAGRIALAAPTPAVAAVLVDGAFLVVLAAAVWREILGGRNMRNVPVALMITLFALANLAFHLEDHLGLPAGLAQRLALGVLAMLIGLIGGRIVPSFTRNWLAREGRTALPAPFDGFDRLTIATAAAALVCWVASPDGLPAGVLLVVAGALHLGRLARWRGHATLGVPILAVLHLGYLWLGVSFLLLGAAALVPAWVDGATALHALTAGAIGTMTLAVMTRASLGHTARSIATSAATFAIYALITAGAVVRVLAPFAGASYLEFVLAGGILWSAAFATFVLAYAPILLRPGVGRQ